MKKIFVLDDSLEMQELIKKGLSEEYLVTVASTVAEAERKLAEEPFDLALLDISLPDGDGLKFFSSLRNSGRLNETPVFFVTGNVDVGNRVLGFSHGADDYITKPFYMAELKARIDAKLKKVELRRDKENLFQVGNLTMNASKQEVVVADGADWQHLDLTSREFRILHYLAKNEGQVLTRTQLIDKIWGHGVHVLERTVDTHVSNLRKKLRRATHNIKAVHSVGYTFCKADADARASVADPAASKPGRKAS